MYVMADLTALMEKMRKIVMMFALSTYIIPHPKHVFCPAILQTVLALSYIFNVFIQVDVFLSQKSVTATMTVEITQMKVNHFVPTPLAMT
jgi:hypothetical protein